jgi:hypothetical protein
MSYSTYEKNTLEIAIFRPFFRSLLLRFSSFSDLLDACCVSHSIYSIGKKISFQKQNILLHSVPFSKHYMTCRLSPTSSSSERQLDSRNLCRAACPSFSPALKGTERLFSMLILKISFIDNKSQTSRS